MPHKDRKREVSVISFRYKYMEHCKQLLQKRSLFSSQLGGGGSRRYLSCLHVKTVVDNLYRLSVLRHRQRSLTLSCFAFC